MALSTEPISAQALKIIARFVTRALTGSSYVQGGQNR